MSRLGHLVEAVQKAELSRRFGTVLELHGLAMEAEGPRSRVGELCAVMPERKAFPDVRDVAVEDLLRSGEQEGSGALLAEVVGVRKGRVTLMPYGTVAGRGVGSLVVALGDRSDIGVGRDLIGRVIDGFGRPLDGRPAPRPERRRPLRTKPMNPMERPRIRRVLETGVRVVDSLLTLGQGQRMGIFAGSGVGKSTLLGMIAREVKADVNVIALIGERGREVRDFVERHLSAEGLARTVVVVATADQPALARIRAAHAAVAIAEAFREDGRQVFLTMDSITRYAMARREVGLSAGEPPTARGYTPSVFAELPELCERCGTAASGGAITALFTVLVEGDDLNEPIADCLRAVLDGHIVLSRKIAHQGQYPAIDVLKSTSRLLSELATAEEQALVRAATGTIAQLERSHQMVELGAYERGSNPELDLALFRKPRLSAWLRQDGRGGSRAEAMSALSEILQAVPPAERQQGPGRAVATPSVISEVTAKAREGRKDGTR